MQRRVENNRPAPGPLSEIVRRSRESPLEQYLLLHALASNNDESAHDVRLPATLGSGDPRLHRSGDGGCRTRRVARRFAQLALPRGPAPRGPSTSRTARARLAARRRRHAGDPYEHPGADARGRQLDDGPGYLQLPYAYWRERWHERLSLSAKAGLLVALTLGDGFPLPYGQFPAWYGFSSSTGERGVVELRDHSLLHREQHRRADPESPVGYADVYRYPLLAPLRTARRALEGRTAALGRTFVTPPGARRAKAKRAQPHAKDRAQPTRRRAVVKKR